MGHALTNSLGSPVAADALERLEARIKRERAARATAEKLLEDKSLELFLANESLKTFVSELEVEVEKRTAALRHALSNAERATEQKSAFFAAVSHEIRTPLNGVMGMTQLLASTSLSTEQSVLVKALLQSGGQLLTVVNDVLDLSAFEAGAIRLEQARFDVRTSLNSIALLFSAQAKEKGLEIQIKVAQDVPVLIYADENRVRQILSNFVSNAIKFTKRGKVTLGIELERDESKEYLRIYVSDTGIGIAQGDLDKLFNPYHRADSVAVRSIEGTGLGLAVCAKLALMMNSKIEVRSELGVGTTFSINLPISEIQGVSSEQTLSQSRAELSVGGNELLQTSVLVVDDNESNLLLLGELLSPRTRAVATARDGIEAVEKFQSTQPDVILMDIRMPRLDGIGATKAIREISQQNDLKIIGLSASAMSNERNRAIDAGMDDLLVKPVNLADLIATLERIRAQA